MKKLLPSCAVAALCGFTLFSLSVLHAQVPQIISYQGRVAVGAVNFHGTGEFKFALVDAAGTTFYWTNNDSLPLGTPLGPGSVPDGSVFLSVAKGLYSVLLGDPSIPGMTPISPSVFSNPDVRLRVWFGDGTATGYQLLAPDQRIAAVGYAMVAGTLQSGAAISASTLDVSGTMHVGSYAVGGTPKLIQFGDLGYVSIGENTADDRMELTAGSFVFNNGSVGIGLTNPSAKLEVAGTVKGTAFIGDGAGLTNIPASAVATPPPGMALIPAGAFTMGNSVAADTDITDATPISTTVSAFYMDVNEVTMSQWQSVYFWATSNGYTFIHAGAGKGANHPVQTVDWYDVVKWCNARSEQAGKTPVYYTNDAQTTIYKSGNVNVTNAQVKWTANGYRLPTEAEWEKAARGGRTGQRFPWGNTIPQNLANYFGNTGFSYDLGPNGYNAIGSIGGTSPATSPAGSFALNGYGLNDMAGNVFEWCWDWYGTPYAGGTDPHGAASGCDRVFRGGSWANNARDARCAVRYYYTPSDPFSSVGFRAVLAPGQP